MLSRVLRWRPDGGDAGAAVLDAPAASSDATPAADVVADAPAADPAAAPVVPADAPKAEEAKPVEYTLKLPENAALDPASVERTVAIARARGLSNDAAQAVLDLANQEAATVRDATLAAHAPGGEAYSKLLDGWKAETLADVTLGKTLEERVVALKRGEAVIEKFVAANPEQGAAMKTFLNTSGLGERREVAHFFAWLGRAASETPLEVGGATNTRSALDQMYPSHSK